MNTEQFAEEHEVSNETDYQINERKINITNSPGQRRVNNV